MASIEERKGKSGVVWRAKIRLRDFPTETKTFKERADAEKWGAEREVFLASLRPGGKPLFQGNSTSFLHVKSGRLRAISLRPYQSEAVASTIRQLLSVPSSRPLVSMPTGSGKTIVISALIEHLIDLTPGARFLVATHSRELVDQDYKKFVEFACVEPEKIGVFSAGLHLVEKNKQITFGTIQTLHSRSFDEKIDYLFIDEAHLLSNKDSSMYRLFIKKAQINNPSIRIVGFTATPYRLDSGVLFGGDDDLFTDVSFEANIKELVRDKFLAPLISTGNIHHVDESHLSITAGDFSEASAEKEMMGITPAIMGEIAKYSKGRKAWLVFCVSINHAQQVKLALSSVGIKSAVVTSRESEDERLEAIASFRDGTLRCLVNVNVLTTGFDVPKVDLIISLRPTTSTALWVQICGRGMRPSPRKQNCLVLDFASNIARHGPIDEIQMGDKKAPVKWNKSTAKPCAVCNTLCGPRVIVCPNCGTMLGEGREHTFVELEQIASSLPVLRMGAGATFAKVKKQTKNRIKDIRDILRYYLIDDISEGLRFAWGDAGRLSGFFKYARVYQSLLEKNNSDLGEVGYSIDDLAQLVGEPLEKIEKSVKNGTFPRPRLWLASEEAGYSLMQVAVILSGDASALLQRDDTFLWYQYMANLLETDLVAALNS